jgi:biotin carboxyl carrier protein
MRFEVLICGETRIVELERTAFAWSVLLDGQKVAADVAEIDTRTLSILLNGESHEIRVTSLSGGALKVQTGLHEFTAEVTDPRAWRGGRRGGAEAEGRQQIVAPMPGKVIRVLVGAGEKVEAGQGVMVVEAMKMQNEIRSPKSGTVERVLVEEGQAVNAGEVLAWVE